MKGFSMNAHDQVSASINKFWQAVFKDVSPLPEMTARITEWVRATVEKDRVSMENLFGTNYLGKAQQGSGESMEEIRNNLDRLEFFALGIEQDAQFHNLGVVKQGVYHVESEHQFDYRNRFIAELQHLSHDFARAMQAQFNLPDSASGEDIRLAARRAGEISARVLSGVAKILDSERSSSATGVKAFTLRQMILSGADFSKLLHASPVHNMKEMKKNLLDFEKHISFPAPAEALSL